MTPDPRLSDLFVRYWDNALTPADAAELRGRLADDESAREAFEQFALHAVVAGEHLREPTPAAAAPVAARRAWSRRRWLGLAGTGVAAGIAAVAFAPARWFGGDTAARLSATAGDVTVKTPTGEVMTPGGAIPSGSIVSTNGPSASGVLVFPNGTEVALTGDSAVTVLDNGRKLLLLRGTATAHVPAGATDDAPLTLSTSEASLSRLSGVVLTIGRVLNTTEVGVQSGRASVVDAAGDPLEVVHTGECLTVRADGKHRKTPVEPTPDKFRWDLSRPLPEGWNVGFRELGPDGPAVRPSWWFDPFHKTEMFQIRSDHQWARGFVRLVEDSTFRIRYRADRPGRGQFCLCVRTDSASVSDTGMLEWNGTFAAAEAGGWGTLTVRVADMFDNRHAPKFRGVLVPFLVIFNTYKEDIGLRIADLSVG